MPKFQMKQEDIDSYNYIVEQSTDEELEGFLKAIIMHLMTRYQNDDDPYKSLKKAEWYMSKLIGLYG